MPEEVMQREEINLDKLLYVIDTLKDIAAELVAETDLGVSMLRLLRLVMATSTSTKGAIFIYDEQRERLKSGAERGSEYKTQLQVGPEVGAALAKNAKVMDRQTFAAAFPALHAANRANPILAATVLWMPLAVQGRLVGLLALGEKFTRTPYGENDVSLLTMISRQIAVFVNNHLLVTSLNERNAQLREANQELDDRNRRLDTLYRISLELNEQMQDSQRLLRTLIDKAMSQARAHSGVLLYYDEDRQVLFTMPESQYNLKLPANFTLPLDSQLGKALLSGGTAMEEGDLEKRFGLPGRHLLGVPMKTRDRSLGLLCLLDKQVPNGAVAGFNEQDVKLLTSLANQAATTLDNARLYELATVDGMTKLYVRRYLDQRLQEETKKAIRFQKQLSLLMMDIDHFKQFNTKYGHQTGDEVLRMVAAQIKGTIRKDIDIPARYGGEELTVIMPETELQGAQLLAERIRVAVAEAWLPGPQGQRLQVTISLGVASLADGEIDMPAGATDEERLMKKADTALYRAKDAGRNQVAVYT